jgi:hypothetical protein
MPIKPETLAMAYLAAKAHVIDSGFAEEIDWQEERGFESISETEFLREAAWVVLSSGFRESVVRRLFPEISRAFLNWIGAEEIENRMSECQTAALLIFAHKRKIAAIVDIISRAANEGFCRIKEKIKEDGVAYIQQLPFMGPVTSLHLAKNVGLCFVKPDRHLVRIASLTGYPSPDLMCRTIASVVGESIPVVDLVVWRYATLDRDLSIFRQPMCRDVNRSAPSHWPQNGMELPA